MGPEARGESNETKTPYQEFESEVAERVSAIGAELQMSLFDCRDAVNELWKKTNQDSSKVTDEMIREVFEELG